MADEAILDVLIRIREDLAGLSATRAGLREGKEEAKSFGATLKEAFGIGTGMEIARRGIDLLKESINETAGEAIRFATETKNTSATLGLTTAVYQTLRLEFVAAGADASRLNAAISAQTRSLAEARDPASAAAQAYRDLGLEAAAIERMPVAERIIAVAHATAIAADQATAFTAASQLLEARGLKPMLSALTNIGREGVDALTKLHQAQGLIMSAQAVQGLAQLSTGWDEFKHTLVVATGETMNRVGTFSDFLVRKLGVVGMLLAGPLGMSLSSAMTPKGETAVDDPAAAKKLADELARRQALLSELKETEVDLAATQAMASVAENNGLLSAQEKQDEKLAALQAEVEIRQRIVTLLGQTQQFDRTKTAQEKTTDLIKAQTDLQRAINDLQTSLGHGSEMKASQIETYIAQLEQQMKFLQAVDPEASEIDMHRRLLPVLELEIDAYHRLAAAKFPDSAELLVRQKFGTITPDDLARLNDYIALRDKVSGVVATKNEFMGRNNRPQGVQGGIDAWLANMGTLSQQTAQIVNQSLGSAISSLGNDIWEAEKGTQSWGKSFIDLGDVAGRMLTQIITQMLVVQAINAGLGLFGKGLVATAGGYTIGAAPNTSSVVSDGLFAGGGTFYTQGRTNITVGDNPGGIELVQVTPISGRGQTTLNGNAIKMAGGGSAVVDSRTGTSDSNVVIHQTLNFGSGVSRQEIMGMIPAIVTATKGAVLDAQKRRKDGFH